MGFVNNPDVKKVKVKQFYLDWQAVLTWVQLFEIETIVSIVKIFWIYLG